MSCGGNCECASAKAEVVPERVKQWREFSAVVEKHLRDYTVPQYGDVGEDEITNYSCKDCVKQVEKYAKRFGSQSREGQQELDFLKMAHYSQCAWEKYEPAEEEEDLFFEGDRKQIFGDFGAYLDGLPAEARIKIVVEEL